MEVVKRVDGSLYAQEIEPAFSHEGADDQNGETVGKMAPATPASRPPLLVRMTKEAH